MTQQILLLTAAIDTSPQMGNNQRSDSHLRRRDYLEGLKFYIEELPAEVTDIVFCENTGADLKDFEALKGHATTFGRNLFVIGFVGETSPLLGKGVCEFEILDFAHRWMWERFPLDSVVWKITGRLQLINIRQFIKSRPDKADLYIDARSVPLIGESLGGNNWVEMRVMSYRIAAYQDLLFQCGESCGYVTEKGLFELITGIPRNSKFTISPRFRTQPRFKGICGGSNKDYQSVEYRFKDGIRNFTRRYAPFLWV